MAPVLTLGSEWPPQNPESYLMEVRKIRGGS